MKTKYVILWSFSLSLVAYSQHITNTLGTGGLFSIKDGAATFLSLKQSNGYVGIGTTNPLAKLDVNGSDALINGLTIGKGTNNLSYNSAFGYRALYPNTIGNYNTASGYQALYYNTEGDDNTANGYRSLHSNTTGNWNTANGYQALCSNTDGDKNTANGLAALYSNTTGNQNTANGYKSLFSNTTGDQNTANGFGALYSNITGYNNTANGFAALYFNTEGDSNTASGYKALYSNTTGELNSANGFGALYYNTAGGYNTANGYKSLYSNTTADFNTANGYEALYSNTTGTYNTANGMFALFYNTIDDNNTGIGYSAGDYFTFSQGTFLGKGAYPNAGGYSNVMGLGYNARPTASNQVRIGNSSVTSIGGYAGWTNLSDGRYKTSVQENVKGLDFVMKLRPVTYRLDVNRLAADLKEDQKRDENGNIITALDQNDIKSRNEKSQIVYTGFIAQEVEKIAKEIGFDFSGIDAPKNENDFYGLRYAEFVVPLVKAVQEQQRIIEELTRRIEELEKK